MTNNISTGYQTDYLYKDQLLHDELRKGDTFCSPTVFETSNLHVELKCYAVELQSQTKLEDPVSTSKLTTKRNVNYHNVSNEDSSSNLSPSNSVSCESFYSCRSSTSVQEVKHQLQNKSEKKDIKHITDKSNKNNNLKEDFLDQLTMVNALVLSNSVNECLRNNKDNNVSKSTNNSISRKEIPENNRYSNKYYSGAFTCKINQTGDTKKTYSRGKNTISDRAQSEIQGKLNIANPNMKEIKELQVPRMDYGEKEIVQNSLKNEQSQATEMGESKFVFQKKRQPSLRLKRSANKVPKIAIANIGSFFQKNKSEIVEGKRFIEHVKLNIAQGYETTFLLPTHLKTSTRYIVEQKPEPAANNRSTMLYGDGNIVYKRIPNSYQQINKYFLGDIGDSQIKTLISQSLKKFQTESREVAQFCLSLSCKRKEKNCINYNPHDHAIDLNNKLKLSPSGKCINSSKNDRKSPATITEIPNIPDVNVEYLLPAKREGHAKRKSSERKTILPVIEEESTEYLESNSGEENEMDDCCLTDRSGNPISLFDSQGLPLTDGSGRPLRFANGKLMMKCDNNGLPIIDDDMCDIHDMFGRTPHDESFDPSINPNTAIHNKLSTNDGKPLLLFDTEGRPLTSVSGTMLVDSSGRGLVRLVNSCNGDVISDSE